MDLSKYAGSRFLKLADVANGPKRKIIASVVEGQFDKPVMQFADGTRLSLNVTNVNTLLDLFGSADSEYVVGKLVEIYAGTTKYQGADKPSVLLRGVESEFDDFIEQTKVADPPADHPAVAAPFSDEIPDHMTEPQQGIDHSRRPEHIRRHAK
jgi:hypothetical protein